MPGTVLHGRAGAGDKEPSARLAYIPVTKASKGLKAEGFWEVGRKSEMGQEAHWGGKSNCGEMGVGKGVLQVRRARAKGCGGGHRVPGRPL